MKQEKHILITNDDGIDSPGIHALVHALKPLGKITVVAPDRQQSAVGHALTISSPLRAVQFHRNGDMFGWAINGTPSDCVKLAVTQLLSEKPDIIISGINHGQNTSINVLYSGTVSAATEGFLIGIPSIAFSSTSYSPYDDCSKIAQYAFEITEKILNLQESVPMLLNVNIPYLENEEVMGTKITHLSNSHWDDEYLKRTDPYGREHYWFDGKYKLDLSDPESDDTAINEKFISITPLEFHFTNQNLINILKKIF